MLADVDAENVGVPGVGNYKNSPRARGCFFRQGYSGFGITFQGLLWKFTTKSFKQIQGGLNNMYKEHRHCRSMEARGRGHGRGPHMHARSRCRERTDFSQQRTVHPGHRHRGHRFGARWDEEAVAGRYGPPPWSPYWQSQSEEDAKFEKGAFGPPPWAESDCCHEQEEVEARADRLSSRRARLEAWKAHLENRLNEIDRALNQLGEDAGIHG